MTTRPNPRQPASAPPLASKSQGTTTTTPLPKAVLWDMDGTLIDSERVWDIALAEYAPQLGLTLTHELRQRVLGTSITATLNSMFDAAGTPAHARGYTGAGEWLRRRVAALFAHGIPWRPGAEQALDFVASLDIPMALVTNTDRSLTTLALDTIGPTRFATTVCIDDVKHGKPAPDPYLLAAQRLGQPIHECLAVEDSPTGTAAALAAGCATLVVPSDSPVPEVSRLMFRNDLLDLTVNDIASAFALTRA